jgi:asparagine N-glycosylation enzyme membrane subunit Stt3
MCAADARRQFGSSCLCSAQIAPAAIGATIYAFFNSGTGQHVGAAIIVWTVTAGLFFPLFRALYRGANWARFICLAVISLALALLPSQPTQFDETWKVALYVTQTAITVVAVGLLFLPVCNRWFSRKGRALSAEPS